MNAVVLGVYNFLLCIGLGLTQIHIGAINELETLTCPVCDGKAHAFPACLNGPSHPCHPDEVCSVKYTDDQPVYKCQKAVDCQRPAAHPTLLCPLFGVEIHLGQCQACCGTISCVQGVTQQIQHQFSQRLLCPGSCTETNLAECVQAGTYCTQGQFCEVVFDDHLSVKGQCRNNNELPKCLEEQSKHPCVITEHAHRCFWDCCSDTTCLTKHFSPYIVVNTISQTTQRQVTATMAPTLPPTPATTQAPITGPSVKPITCYDCDGGLCQHNERNATCPGGYCMLTVDEDTGGGRYIKKRCSDETECYDSWSNGWKEDQLCAQYLLTPTKISGQDMSCQFCCTGDHCNNHIDIQNVYKF
ncbi:unnamed protein product [Lymnaea stagnalis]|uniref:Uncharacterized protein n=1 Tax=Lymnaea stagnalis TaxID=6523 RepID=A0AAV2I2F1_LYMST